RGIDPGVFNSLETKQHVLPGQRLAILEMRIPTYGEGVRQFILTDLRARYRELGAEFQGLRLAVQEVFEDILQDTCRPSSVTRQGIGLLGIAEEVAAQPVSRDGCLSGVGRQPAGAQQQHAYSQPQLSPCLERCPDTHGLLLSMDVNTGRHVTGN